MGPRHARNGRPMFTNRVEMDVDMFWIYTSVSLGLNWPFFYFCIAVVGSPFCSGSTSLRLSCENTDLYSHNHLNQ